MDAMLPHEAAATGHPILPVQEPDDGPRPATVKAVHEAAPSPVGLPAIAAGLLLVAGVLHLLLVEAHMAHARAAGLFFLAVGAAQVVWGIVYGRAPSPRLGALGLVLLAVAPTVLYVVTRIWRAPWHAGPEAVDTLGIAVQLLQVAAAGVLLWQFRRALPAPRAVAALGLGVLVGLAGYGAGLAVEPVAWLADVEVGAHAHGGIGHDGHDDHGGHGSAVLIAGTRGEPTVGTLAYFGPTTGQGIQDLCRSLGQDHQDCWLQYLQHYLASAGAVAAFDALVQLTQVNHVANVNSHPLAHVLGHQAYQAYGYDIALAMQECSYELFQGCHHGALQTYFQDLSSRGQPIDQATLRAVCPDTLGSFDAYVCQHGMGHGVMMHTNYDLVGSLDLCALLATWLARENCYGGVHMENVVGFLDSQKPGHVPHDHGHGPTEYWVKADDVAYPCNAIAWAYQDSCWRMQTSLVIHFNGADFHDLSRVCDEEAGPHKLACYNGVGRLAAPHGQHNPSRMSQLCSYGDSEAEAVCVKAFTAGVILQLNSPQAGLDVCGGLPDHQKEPCYWEAGRFAASMVGGAEGEALCDGVAAEYVATCHEGRRV